MSATLALSQAIIVPAGTPNGIYAHDVVADGSNRMEHIAPLPERRDSHSPSRASAKFRRVALPGGRSGCTTRVLDPDDLVMAQYMLEDYCQDGADVPSKKHITYVSNNAVAYVCNYGKKNHCISSEAQAAYASLSGDCGNLSAPLGGW